MSFTLLSKTTVWCLVNPAVLDFGSWITARAVGRAWGTVEAVETYNKSVVAKWWPTARAAKSWNTARAAKSWISRLCL